MPKAAIDMDGTLLEPVDLHALAWQEALLKFGHDKSGAASVSRPNICRLCAPSRRSQTCYDACVTRELQIAVASSAKKDEVGMYPDVAGITDLVDLATSSDDVEESKPAPDIFEIVLQSPSLASRTELAYGVPAPYRPRGERMGILAASVYAAFIGQFS